MSIVLLALHKIGEALKPALIALNTLCALAGAFYIIWVLDDLLWLIGIWVSLVTAFAVYLATIDRRGF